MKKKPYLPTREADRVIWLNNFASKIGGYATTFGLTAAEVKTITDSAALYVFVLNLIEQSNAFNKQLTSFKDLLSNAAPGTTLGAFPTLVVGTVPTLPAAGIFTFISGIVQRIKGNKANYTVLS